MAHMYPIDGPTKSTTSPAERRIYALLQKKLDDNYHVFHSMPWSSVNKDGAIVDGEADFIIFHPDHGILLFEVKGGAIGYDGAVKQWTSTDHFGVTRTIKDPFLQARESVHVLKQHLTKLKATKPYAKNYWLEYAVWFPDISWIPGSSTSMHIENSLVLDSTSQMDPERAILAILSRKKHHRHVLPDAERAFIDVLVPHHSIKVRLRDQITNEQGEYVHLREDQYRRYTTMGHFPRVTVRGPAGTGKTVIALEQARRFASQDLKVLFVCSNRSLARWLLSMVNEEPDDIRSRITVHNMEQLCTELSGQAELLLNEPTEYELQQHEELGSLTLQKKLAAEFTRALAVLEARGQLPSYDAIIVDEGQDFERPLWGPLYKLLRDRHKGKFIAFYDPAQREGDGDGTPAIPGGKVQELKLTENCRNTQFIFEFSHQFYLGMEAPACIGPEGHPVVWVDPETQVTHASGETASPTAALELVLDDLVDNEGVSPRDIVVVVGSSQRASTLYRRKSLGKHLLSNNTAIQDPNIVRVTTVRSVKGLEAPIVILVELDGIQSVRATQPATYSRYMYIATSRALHHLVVLSTPEKTLPLQPSLWAV